MTAYLFTLPNCCDCSEIKKYLDDRAISYTETSLGFREGKKIWFDFSKRLKVPLKKDDRGIILPIFLTLNDAEGIEKMLQGEDIKTLAQ